MPRIPTLKITKVTDGDEITVPNVGAAIGIAAPALTALFLIGHSLALAMPALLGSWLLRTGRWMEAFFFGVAAWSILIPISLMLVWGLMARLLPKPKPGPIQTKKDAIKHALVTGIYQFARVTGSRVAISLIPIPAWFYYKLAGAKIDFGVLLSSPDCLPDPHLVEIGAGSIIGQGSILTGHFQPSAQFIRTDKIRVGKNVLIGVQACIFPGTSIGDNSIIQAQSVVLPGTVIPANEVWGGFPARKIKERVAPPASDSISLNFSK